MIAAYVLISGAVTSTPRTVCCGHVQALLAAAAAALKNDRHDTSIDRRDDPVGSTPQGPDHTIAAPDDAFPGCSRKHSPFPAPGAGRFAPARVQLAYDERLRRAQATSGSRLHLTAALKTFERLGARPWAGRATAELPATGLARPAPGREATFSLTAQEHEIAMLAAGGMSNKQIGQRPAAGQRQPAAAARQRSLEATVEWSYQLLSEPEQQVFRRLAVFPGPFTLDAAEAIAGTGAGQTVLRLVDCSLLVPPVTGPDGRSRYLMLQTLRGYGLSQLREAGEEHDAAAALAVHALEVAEQAATEMAVRSGEQPAALWLDAEDAVVHQGLAWALEHDPPAALRLATALAPWWMVRGRWIHGTGLLQRAVEQTGPDQSGWYSAHMWLGKLVGRTVRQQRPQPFHHGRGRPDGWPAVC